MPEYATASELSKKSQSDILTEWYGTRQAVASEKATAKKLKDYLSLLEGYLEGHARQLLEPPLFNDDHMYAGEADTDTVDNDTEVGLVVAEPCTAVARQCIDEGTGEIGLAS